MSTLSLIDSVIPWCSQSAQEDLRKVRADVAELIEAAGCVVDSTPESQRENWPCHKGITTAAKCGRCSRDLRLAAALARVTPMTREQQAAETERRG